MHIAVLLDPPCSECVTTTKGVSHPAPLLTVASAEPRLPSRTAASTKSASYTATLIYLLEIYSPFGVSNFTLTGLRDSSHLYDLSRMLAHAHPPTLRDYPIS